MPALCENCTAVALDVSTLNFTSLAFPPFSAEFGVISFDIANMTCTDLQLGGLGLRWSANASTFGITEGGGVNCRMDFSMGALAATIVAEVDVHPSAVHIAHENSPSNECLAVNTTLDSCLIDVNVTRLYTDPRNIIIDLILKQVRGVIGDEVNKWVCNTAVPNVQASIVNNTVPDVPPRRTEQHSLFPARDAPLIRALRNVVNGLRVGTLAFTGDFDSDYAERIIVKAGFDSDFVWDLSLDVVPADPSVTAVTWAQGLVDQLVAGVLPNPFPVPGLPEGEISASVDVQAKSNCVFQMNVDVSLHDARENYIDVYVNPGITFANTALNCRRGDSFGNLVTHGLLPLVEGSLNKEAAALLTAAAASSPTAPPESNATVVRLAIRKDVELHNDPLYSPLLGIAVLGLVAGVLLVRRNLRRHAERPVLSLRTGAPISAARIVAEDVLMIGGAVACLVLFAASNSTTAATVDLGDELHLYAFSLSNTVTDLWGAGLKPLSILVLLFSGVYPYVKLLSILAFTVWANRPGSRVLMLIDCIGKFSLLDTFAFVVMASGLEIRGIADVETHPSFFIFMGTTIASIALGNYATQLWRVGTTVRLEDVSVEDTEDHAPVANADEPAADVDVSAPPPKQGEDADGNAPLPEVEHGEQSAPWISAVESTPPPERGAKWQRFALAHLPRLTVLVVAGCSLPAWVVPCLRYSVGGFARLFTPATKSVTLYTLSSLNGRGCGIAVILVTLLTTLVVPCLHVLLYPRCAFLASWCAADAFLLACLTGLLQLRQFVTFVLGDGMSGVYTAHATLLWPLAPLGAAALLVWVYIVRHILHGGAHVRRVGSTAATPSSSP